MYFKSMVDPHRHIAPCTYRKWVHEPDAFGKNSKEESCIRGEDRECPILSMHRMD